MEELFKRIGKKLIIFLSIIMIMLTVIIEVYYYREMACNLLWYALRISQVIALICCTITMIIGAIIQITNYIKNSDTKKIIYRLAFSMYIMIIYVLRQIIKKRINILEILFAVIVTIIISFGYSFYFSSKEKEEEK